LKFPEKPENDSRLFSSFKFGFIHIAMKMPWGKQSTCVACNIALVKGQRSKNHNCKQKERQQQNIYMPVWWEIPCVDQPEGRGETIAKKSTSIAKKKNIALVGGRGNHKCDAKTKNSKK